MPVQSSSRHTRTTSPPLSTSSQAFTATINQQQKLNIVTRLAVEGNAKQGKDGASIKMYLKMSLPLDSITPGSTIPLFPEENVKILTSQVHPIDNNSVPYNFSSTTCPLLHNAARALNLPARSSLSYSSVFGLSTSSSIRSSVSRSNSSANGPDIPPLEDKYTGHILVSGYNVSYVLPKEFPPRFHPNMDDGDAIRISTFKNRRLSISEKTTLQFMAAIDMWVPYVSRPPRAPYLLSIPIPRCLSNHVRLRIFPPSTTSASFASLSSAEDDGAWELTSDPHVTRSASSRSSRSNPYTQGFADDESSDSSTTAGFSDGCGIQGTFPSAERLRVRWASPMKRVDVPDGGDGRRRVGVNEAKGEMNVTVLGKDGGGVVMGVEYKGTCKGIWFPGVATLLGMDVSLMAKGSDVAWAPGVETKWTVSGGSGYTGFDSGSPPRAKELIEDGASDLSAPPTRQNSSSSSNSTTSLLRAPLPIHNVAEYSFEGSQTSSALSGTVSTLGSFPPSAPNSAGPSRMPSFNSVVDPPNGQERSPGSALTIHLNINDLLPPSKNVFTFTISGTIIVTPRPRPHPRASSTYASEPELEVLTLPRFTVLAADKESTSTLIRSDADGATVEVYNPSGDIRDAQTRRTVLQRGGLARCGSDGGRIGLRMVQPRIWEDAPLPPSRPRTPNGHALNRVPSSTSLRAAYGGYARPKRDGPLVIPFVSATVTPVMTGDSALPDAYAVRICLPAPCDAESEWLEFGLAQLSEEGSSIIGGVSKDKLPPRVEVAGASLDGIPVKFENTTAMKREKGVEELNIPFEGASSREWLSWVRVRVGEAGGGNVVIDYIVREQEEEASRSKLWWKGKARADRNMSMLLPTFSLPVGKLEVKVESNSSFEVSVLQSNLSHRQPSKNTWNLLHFSMQELFSPRLYLRLHLLPSRYKSGIFARVFGIIPTVISLVLLISLLQLSAEFRNLKNSMPTHCQPDPAPVYNIEPVTVTSTVTSTMFVSTGHSSRPCHTEIPSLSSGETLASLPVETPISSSPLHLPPSPAPTPVPKLDEDERIKSLILFDRFLFRWPIRFEVPPAARASFDSVLGGLGKAWQVGKSITVRWVFGDLDISLW